MRLLSIRQMITAAAIFKETNTISTEKKIKKCECNGNIFVVGPAYTRIHQAVAVAATENGLIISNLKKILCHPKYVLKKSHL